VERWWTNKGKKGSVLKTGFEYTSRNSQNGNARREQTPTKSNERRINMRILGS
jgi:hypothetical protein